MLQEVEISARDPERFRSVLPRERFEAFERVADEMRELLSGRVVWNVNSTAKGGGVVELLRPLLGYSRGSGIDSRWIVIGGTPEFFEVTKRIHNRLHGAPGDGLPLDAEARLIYEDILSRNIAELAGRVKSGDVVVIHDPQPAGMTRAFLDAGASVIWRCHVGVDEPNALVREAWSFLRPYVMDAHAYVFSRQSFIWEGLDPDRVVVIWPSIDVFTPKNIDIDDETVLATLHACGVVAGGTGEETVVFERQDGTPGRVERRVSMVEDAPLRDEDPLVVQVSRLDALKDPIGVINGFAAYVPPETGAHLVYAAPAVDAVGDDPEGARVLRETIAARDALTAEQRSRVHLASLPMDDLDENAFMVNAIQRHARVITQKSIAEGFGLTVAEGMWKARPVVATRVGGIQEQIEHGKTGALLDDPHDLPGFGAAITEFLVDEARAAQIGSAARERVRDQFISLRSLLDYAALIKRVLVRQPLLSGRS
jgi:trehalose synthase